ncbi:MAG: glycosyltransferase family 9 protein [Acidobacteriota bacterium]
MESLLARLPSRSRIAVIRLRSMGDCVLTTPALALLKAYRPDLQVRVVVEPRFAGIFEDNPDVDEISHKVGVRVDMVLNLHGGTRSMWMTMASGAKFGVGFGHHRFSAIYSDRIPRAQEILGEERPAHTAEHLASAMFWLGVPHSKIPRAKLIASRSTDYPPYLVLHPFASAPDKAWPAERFVALAAHMEGAGLLPIIVAGPVDDVSPFSEFLVLRHPPLAELKNLMSGAALFIGNDSGPAHVAAAFGIPVVVLFGPSDPATWAPWRTESRVLTSRGSLAEITIEEVMAAAQALRRENAKAGA